MRGTLDRLRPHAARLVALALILAAYGFTRLPRLPDSARERLVERFRFERVTLPAASAAPAAPAVNRREARSIRPVHPSLARFAGWISSVGAAVALHDLDGDGLANDACLVDVRTDRVLVAPVDGPARYPPFHLGAAPLPYDPETTAPMGCVPGDLNEDGLADLLVYYWGRTPVAFLRRSPAPATTTAPTRSGPSTAVYRPVELVPPRDGEPLRWFTNAATRADLDGDGHADLILGNYFQDGARILDARAGGGETMQHSMSRAFNAGRNRVLRWTGGRGGPEPDVAYEEVAGLDDRIARGWTLAVGAADLDGDLLPELYFANDFGPDRLLHNRSKPGTVRLALVEGRRGFRTVRSKVLGHDSFKGMGVDFADVDGDGDLDFAIANQWEDSYLYRNEAPDPGAFLGLHLLHPLAPGVTRHRPGLPGDDTPGFPAVGAEARVIPGGADDPGTDGDGPPASRVAQVDGGNGHSGVRSPALRFGLGRNLGEVLEGDLDREGSFYTVTDPGTTPFRPRSQVAFGLALGAAYGLLMASHVVFGLFFALTAVCALRGALLASSAWLEARASQRRLRVGGTAGMVPER